MAQRDCKTIIECRNRFGMTVTLKKHFLKVGHLIAKSFKLFSELNLLY